jgi:protein TonB
LRRRAAIALVAFVALSAGLHFVLGPTMTALSPHWRYPNVPEQALSIVTLSHREEPQAESKPTPTPTPPPIPLPHTKRDMSLLQYKELASNAVRLRHTVGQPARRISTIVIEKPASPKPIKAREADVVAAVPAPTPEVRTSPGSARAETGGPDDHLSGTVVWGDDNPCRPIKRAMLAVENRAGDARTEAAVGPDGAILSVQLVRSSGDGQVDQAALDATRATVFAPATLNGLPVHGSCQLDFPPAPSSTT